MAKQAKYGSNKKGDEVEKLSEKLAQDLRQHIRSLVRNIFFFTLHSYIS